MGCGGSTSGDIMRQQQKQQERVTNQSMAEINRAFSGFDPRFYQGVQNKYLGFAMPQLWEQYQQNRNQLGFNLGNQGLLDSSTAQRAQSQLGEAMTRGQVGVGNQALQTSQDLQRQVAQERANLIAQAQTATNPSSIGQQATAMAGSMTGPSTFAPVGQFFGNLGQLFLARQAANTFNPLTNYYNRMGTGFGLPSTANYVM